jgi:hypothetical protein
MDLDQMCKELCDVERDRLTAAEIGLDEALTIMDRHGLKNHDPIYRALATLSGTFHRALTGADGPVRRDERLRRIRDVLTDALPMSDADLGMQ